MIWQHCIRTKQLRSKTENRDKCVSTASSSEPPGHNSMASTTQPLAPPPAPPSLGLMTDSPSADIMDNSGETYRDTENTDVNGQGLPDAEVKMEAAEDEEDEGEDGQKKKRAYKPPWRRPKVAGTRLKRKKVPGFKNTRIKKYAQPKNAVMCLNELETGITYETVQEGGISQPFCISVEVKGQKYRGFGSSKQLARQAAAEAALISYVKPPGENKQEDQTPWATLVSFAMYKMFNDWREGRVGMCPPPAQPYGTAVPTGSMLAGINAFFNQPPASGDATAGVEEAKPQPVAVLETITAHLGGRIPGDSVADPKAKAKPLPRPAKQVPEGAAAMHPVMVLNQMKPGVQYSVTESVRDSKAFFTLKTSIDGQEFTGEGPNVKKAKLALAKTAILELFGVESSFAS
ncbi:double-stranded RNA-specific editase 1-like isoform X2 [Scylla paramamosain]|uniref:double-stranded RNA-specific editase 1-like isoform X2 n=1 Tax=Scylla paramamosain TaxID=85552 RepID=UPI003083512D